MVRYFHMALARHFSNGPVALPPDATVTHIAMQLILGWPRRLLLDPWRCRGIDVGC